MRTSGDFENDVEEAAEAEDAPGGAAEEGLAGGGRTTEEGYRVEGDKYRREGTGVIGRGMNLMSA